MALSKNKKTEIIKKFQKNDADVGSVFVQVAVLTEEIKLLTEHLLKNKKDFISKRGLYTKVSKRKNLLNYLKQNDLNAYRNLISELELRHS